MFWFLFFFSADSAISAHFDLMHICFVGQSLLDLHAFIFIKLSTLWHLDSIHFCFVGQSLLDLHPLFLTLFRLLSDLNWKYRQIQFFCSKALNSKTDSTLIFWFLFFFSADSATLAHFDLMHICLGGQSLLDLHPTGT